MRTTFLLSAMVAALAASTAPSFAADCDITVGLVMELTGPAGEYGQAGAKSVEMAFRDFNDAGGVGGCKIVADTRDSQSQGNVAVDQATQLVNIKKVPVIIGGIISSVSIPILTSVTAPAGVVQVSPASSSPTLTELGRDGKTNGVFFRTITSDALQGTAAAKYAIDQGLKKIAIINVNSDFGVNMVREFATAYQKLGGTITSTTPYNEKQSSYSSEASAAMAGEPDALYLVSTPVDGATIARAWISGGGKQTFLLNDGMNSKDFIDSVGAQYLENAYGTSSGTSPTASTESSSAP
jgi:ABC-type branched-subunit amino acid transport system substrate-binding protein